jgi:hypothetical protein
MALLIQIAGVLVVVYGAAMVGRFVLLCIVAFSVLVFRWLLGLLRYQKAQPYRKPAKSKSTVTRLVTPSPVKPSAPPNVDPPASIALPLHHPDLRFVGGFDRWNYASIGARSICCPMSMRQDHALGPHGGIWWWHSEKEIWMLPNEEKETPALADNAAAVTQFRRALPIIRLFMSSTHHGERAASAAALGRLADILSERWRWSDASVKWIWSASSLYWEALRIHRWQLLGDDPPAYDKAVEDDLRRFESVPSG